MCIRAGDDSTAILHGRAPLTPDSIQAAEFLVCTVLRHTSEGNSMYYGRAGAFLVSHRFLPAGVHQHILSSRIDPDICYGSGLCLWRPELGTQHMRPPFRICQIRLLSTRCDKHNSLSISPPPKGRVNHLMLQPSLPAAAAPLETSFASFAKGIVRQKVHMGIFLLRGRADCLIAVS